MRKGSDPPSMVPSEYSSHYGHFMEQYWATQGAQHLDYEHSEKYGAYDSFQHGEHDEEGRDNDIKSEHNWSVGLNSDPFAKQTPEKGNLKTPRPLLEMKCQFCPSYFDDLPKIVAHLHLHLERVASKDTDLECMVKGCDYKADYDVNDEEESNPKPVSKYVQLRCIEQHVRNEHLNMQAWKCGFCDKQFNQKQSLVYHYKMHEDPTKQYCNICQRFRDAGKMSSHDAEKCSKMALIEKRLECNECGKIFRSVPSLWLHKKIHTSERYICEFCDKSFTQKGNRKTHIMKKHADKLYENPIYLMK